MLPIDATIILAKKIQKIVLHFPLAQVINLFYVGMGDASQIGVIVYLHLFVIVYLLLNVLMVYAFNLEIVVNLLRIALLNLVNVLMEHV
jgi:hypothetical protein